MNLVDLEIAKRKALDTHVKARIRADKALDKHIKGKLSREKLEKAIAARDTTREAFRAAWTALEKARGRQ